MKKDFLTIFSPVLWTAKQVQGENGQHRKVHGVEHLQHVFEIIGLQTHAGLYFTHQHRINNWRVLAEREARLLSASLNDVCAKYKRGQQFRAKKYLNNASLPVYDFIFFQGEHTLCYPKRDNELLVDLIGDYHTCTFLEQHRSEFDDTLFINLTRHLKSNLIRSNVSDIFHWTDQLDFEFLNVATHLK